MKKLFCAVLVILLVFSFAACGNRGASDDPNLGKYLAVTVFDDGYSYDAADAGFGNFAIELKSGGKATLFMDGDTSNGTWKLNGTDFSFSAGLASFNGSLENGKLTIEDMFGLGLNLILYKDGIKPSGAESSVSSGSDVSGALAWWDGEWYGSFEVTSSSGLFAEWEGLIWDCYAVIDVEPDGTAMMYVWNDAIDMAIAEISIDLDGGIAEMGSARSIGGEAFWEPLRGGDWIIIPTYDGYEDYWGNVFPDNYMELEATTDGDDGYLDYKIILRPWGIMWDDISSEFWPPGYEGWYAGKDFNKFGSMIAALEDTTIDGNPAHIHTALAGGVPSGGVPSSGDSASTTSSGDLPQFGDGILFFSYDQLTEAISALGDYWVRNEGYKLTYDYIVSNYFGGVNGYLYEEGDDGTYIKVQWFGMDKGGGAGLMGYDAHLVRGRQLRHRLRNRNARQRAARRLRPLA